MMIPVNIIPQKEAAPDPTWLTVPTFSWVVSKTGEKIIFLVYP